MQICAICPLLFEEEYWFIPKLLEQANAIDIDGKTAIDYYRASGADINKSILELL